MSENQPRKIVIVLFDRTKLIDVTGPLQVFSDARLPAGERAYSVSLISAIGGPVVTDTGVALSTQPFAVCRADPPDTLLLSGGESAFEAAADGELLQFLRFMHPRCRRFGSVCTGAYILGAAGLLEGRRAATHWDAVRRLQEAFPRSRIEKDAIFVADGELWTSAGVTAGIDMALAMVEQDCGRGEALRLAQMLVLHVQRVGGQSQFSAALVAQRSAKGGRFDALIARVRDAPGEAWSVPRLAALAGMSERNFARLFVAETGVSPARFIEDIRVALACELLQRGEAGPRDLLERLGFGNAERLRRAFLRVKGVPPGEYGKRFGPNSEP